MSRFVFVNDNSPSSSEDEEKMEKIIKVTNSWTVSKICREKVPKGWESVFSSSLEDLDHISEKLENIEKTKQIVPNKCDLFKAFHLTPLNKIRVVILGMDPYQNLYSDGTPVSTGLSFSIAKDRPMQPSISNMFKELKNSIDGFKIPNHGDLSSWARQGVLMLNVCLTTEVGISGAHSKYMLWMGFMVKIFEAIGKSNPQCVYVLLGKPAQKMKAHLKGKQIYLETSHPSGFSAHKGFLGSDIFKKVNDILTEPPKLTKKQIKENEGKVIPPLVPIDWNL